MNRKKRTAKKLPPATKAQAQNALGVLYGATFGTLGCGENPDTHFLAPCFDKLREFIDGSKR